MAKPLRSRPSSKIAALVTRTAIRNQGVIETLENMLVVAREQKLTGVAVAAVDAEGSVRTAYEGGENVSTLIGAVERVKFRLLMAQDEE